MSTILLETTDDLSFIVASDKSFDIDRCLKIELAMGLKVGKDMLPQ